MTTSSELQLDDRYKTSFEKVNQFMLMFVLKTDLNLKFIDLISSVGINFLT